MIFSKKNKEPKHKSSESKEQNQKIYPKTPTVCIRPQGKPGSSREKSKPSSNPGINPDAAIQPEPSGAVSPQQVQKQPKTTTPGAAIQPEPSGAVLPPQQVQKQPKTVIEATKLLKVKRQVPIHHEAKLIYSEKGERKEYQLTSNVVVIGRDPKSCDLIIAGDEFMSRTHSILVRTNKNQFYLVDLGSMNGTFVNKEKVTGGVEIKNQSKFMVANTNMILQLGADRGKN